MNHPIRKPLRLPNYNYSLGGAYFLTLCVRDRKPIFWDRRGELCSPENLSPIGMVASEELLHLNGIYENVRLDKYCIMPDHIHMILFLDGNSGRTQFAPTVSRIVKQFKGVVTKRLGFSPWQRSYYDHVIRNEQDYLDIWTYIENNPSKYNAR